MFVRKTCVGSITITTFQWQFPRPHFIAVSSTESDAPSLVYIHTEKELLANRLEVVSPDGPISALYCRKQQGAILIIENSALPSSTGNSPLPCCGDSRRQLMDLCTKDWPTTELPKWIAERWEWLSASLLQEWREGCRQFPLNGRHREKIKQVAAHIYNHPESNDTISQLSKRVGISATYLKTFFRQYYGQSVLQFRQYYRMQACCRLLSNTTIALQDIAFACGFQDDTNLVRSFRQHYGVSPVRGMR